MRSAHTNHKPPVAWNTVRAQPRFGPASLAPVVWFETFLWDLAPKLPAVTCSINSQT